MPKHDPENTPPELRRAPRGDITSKVLAPLTRDAEAALDTLKARWKCSGAEAIRRALLAAAARKA